MQETTPWPRPALSLTLSLVVSLSLSVCLCLALCLSIFRCFLSFPPPVPIIRLPVEPTFRSSSMRTRGPGSPCPLSPDCFWQYITMSGSTLLASQPAWRTAHAQIPRQSCTRKKKRKKSKHKRTQAEAARTTRTTMRQMAKPSCKCH